MTIWRLVRCEIVHHRIGFMLGAAAVSIAVFGFVAAVASLASFDRATERRLVEMDAESARQLKGHEDFLRKTMKGMGFNIHIYPEAQDLGEVYARGYGSATMPQSYVEKLAGSEIVTVNHLLPRLTQMVEWQERERTVLLFGVSGQVPIAFLGPKQKKPIMEPVAEGKVVLGYELHHGAGIAVGDKIAFRGREFEVAELHERRGGVDDITVWISLPAAQQMLGKPGEINSILALECNCESLDRLGEIEKEIGGILPGVKIVELEGKALARAKARNEAKKLREREVANFAAGREQLRAQRASFGIALSLLVAGLSLAWVGYLSLVNVRERTVEIGTLRAIGVGFSKLVGVLLARAFLMGVVGTLTALLVSAALFGGSVFSAAGFTFAEWFTIVVSVPILACAAAWLPAWIGSGRDLASALRND